MLGIPYFSRGLNRNGWLELHVVDMYGSPALVVSNVPDTCFESHSGGSACAICSDESGAIIEDTCMALLANVDPPKESPPPPQNESSCFLAGAELFVAELNATFGLTHRVAEPFCPSSRASQCQNRTVTPGAKR